MKIHLKRRRYPQAPLKQNFPQNNKHMPYNHKENRQTYAKPDKLALNLGT